MKTGILIGIEVGDGVGLAAMVGGTEVNTAATVIATAVSRVLGASVGLVEEPQALSEMANSKITPVKTFLKIFMDSCDSI